MSVDQQSPAAQAGMRKGDLIVAIKGRDVVNVDDLIDSLPNGLLASRRRSPSSVEESGQT